MRTVRTEDYAMTGDTPGGAVAGRGPRTPGRDRSVTPHGTAPRQPAAGGLRRATWTNTRRQGGISRATSSPVTRSGQQPSAVADDRRLAARPRRCGAVLLRPPGRRAAIAPAVGEMTRSPSLTAGASIGPASARYSVDSPETLRFPNNREPIPRLRSDAAHSPRASGDRRGEATGGDDYDWRPLAMRWRKGSG